MLNSPFSRSFWVVISVFGIAGLLGWVTLTVFPLAKASREVAFGQALSQQPMPEASALYTAETFCSDWPGLDTAAVDCRNGYRLDALAPAQSENASTAWVKGLQSAAAQLDRFKQLSANLSADGSAQRDLIRGLQLSLQQKVDDWQGQLAELEKSNAQPAATMPYTRLFQLMLDMQGTSYDASRNKFGVIHRHVARLTESPPAVLKRAQDLQAVMAWLPWSIGAVAAGLMLLGWWRARWSGLLLMAGFSTISWLGLLIAADASVHFGEGSAVFLLNPLGNQLARQHKVLWIGAVAIAATAILAPLFKTWIYWPLRHLWITLMILLASMGAAYALLGPAMGSETLKVSMAMLAGLVTAAHGRSVHLASQLAPKAMTFSRILRILRFKPPHDAAPMAALDLMALNLAKPVYQLGLFGALGLSIAALVFHDLGATLVTASVAVCALFLIFGTPITVAVMALMGLVAAGLSQTNKLQDRIALMLDPMSASVSDFARLLAFSDAAHDSGFPLGHMAWCNSGGVCVPPQALSDYMPTILGGLFGFNATVAYFWLFLLVIVFMGRSMMHAYLTLKGAVRTLAITAFYLLVCAGAQTVITFLGNWRIIPLTGIGAPLLSIGLSSSLVPCIAMGLFLAVQSARRDAAIKAALA